MKHVQYNWFDLYGSEAEAIRERLSPSVIDFLEQAKVWPLEQLSLTPHLRGVPEPSFLWRDPAEDYGIFEEQFGNSIVLYRANDYEEGQGLILDMDSNLVRYYPWTLDFPDPENDLWIPLEDALDIWKRLVEDGRYVVDSTMEDSYYQPMGWREVPWTPRDRSETLCIWERYLCLIEAKLSQPRSKEVGLVSDILLDRLAIDNFTMSFLQQARKPAFVNIAPTLQIIDDDFLELVLPAIEDRVRRGLRDDEFPALLLFPSSVRIPEPTVLNPTFRDYDRYLVTFWTDWRLLDNRCGIYLTSYTDVSIVAPATDDGVTQMRFIQPYGRFEATQLDMLELDLLDIVIPTRPFRLPQLLALWYDKVDSGAWEVGPQGVVGEIEDLWSILPRKVSEIF
ncbi:hypothetical protein M8818_002892 [Zalaria obscura]|uniref:Uncharacterized protein n=1 Tax=Zalaria obscura TaxID=2024903 RepID=A0ACC3SKA8_9PEZI